MSISTNYDYNWYSQYSNSISSLGGQQRIYNSRDNESADVSQPLSLDTIGEASGNRPKSPLADLVESGTITSEQEKAIKDALETARLAYQTQSGTANASKNPLDSLVESGTITKEQEAAVKSAFDSAKKAHRMPPPPPPQSQQNGNSDPITSTFDGLVTSGTITSEQKDSILSALLEAFQSSQTEDDTIADPLDSLVESGTITEEQQSAVKDAFETGMKAHRMPPPPDKTIDSMTSILDELVEAGKITTEQQDTILNSLKEAFEVMQAENNVASDPLDSLVESGTITEEQQNAVKYAFESAIKAYHAQSHSFEDMFQSSFDTNY